MNDAELYNKSNILQRRDALQCLEGYAKKIQWRNEDETVIDIGSGDGSVTVSILQQFLPGSCTRVLGCDISDNMVQFANKHYATATTSFAVLDIEEGLPEQFVGKFDHAFSFYALHWIKQKEAAFSNIHKLLAKNGDCLFMVPRQSPVFDYYRILASRPKWRNWLKDVERYVPWCHELQDSEKEIKRMMTSIGFKNIDVQCKEWSFDFPSVQSFKNFLETIIPIKLSKELLEEYLEDFVNIVRDRQHPCSSYNILGGVDNVVMNYQLIIVYAQKL